MTARNKRDTVSPLRLYAHLFSLHLRSLMEYKLSFLLIVLGQGLTASITFFSIYFLFARFQGVDGYTYAEVLLCFSVVLAAFSLAEMFFRGLDTFPGMIANGEFDRVMLRPRGAVFQIVASKVEFTRVGRLIQAAVVLCYALPASGIAWTPGKIGLLSLMLFCGTVFFACLFLVYAGLSFFTIEGLEFMNVLTDGGKDFGSYPLSIYGKGILRFMTYVIPMACFQYYPFLYLTGHSGNPLYPFLPLASLLFALPCYGFWRFGVRHFKSTGS